MYKVTHQWNKLKTCVVGSAYPPEVFNFIKDVKLRNSFEKLAIETEEDILDPCLQDSNDRNSECSLDLAEESGTQDADDMIVGVLLALCIILVWANLAWLVSADNRGEG